MSGELDDDDLRARLDHISAERATMKPGEYPEEQPRPDAASPSPSEMEVVADDGAPWVLIKRGLFWRPDGQGYTGIKAEAGRYSDDYAIGYSLHDEGGTARMLWAEAPDLAPSCPEEAAIKHYRSQVLRLTEENKVLRKERAGERGAAVLELADEIDLSRALKARIKALEEALRPFADGALDVSGSAIILGHPEAEAALNSARSALKENAL